MQEIKVFQCEYCDKIYKIKSSCARHEHRCFANPGNKACRTCKHAIKDSDTVYVRPHGDQNYGDADYEVNFTYCEITEKYLIHPTEPCEFKHNCPHWEQGEKLF